MSESVSVPAGLVEALREAFGRDGYGPGPVQNAARALVDAVERPSEDEIPPNSYVVSGKIVWGDGSTAPPSLPDRDEAERAWEAWNAQPENKWPSDGYTHMGFLAGFRAARLTAKDPSAVPATTDRDAERPLTDRITEVLLEHQINILNSRGVECLCGWHLASEPTDTYEGLVAERYLRQHLASVLADLLGDAQADAWERAANAAFPQGSDSLRSMLRATPYRRVTEVEND